MQEEITVIFSNYCKPMLVKALQYKLFLIKGQIISKRFFLAEDSSKKRTNEFVFTSMRRVFDHFLEEIEDSRRQKGILKLSDH